MHIEGYTHRQGRRPGTGALWNLSRFHGWGLDEPTCLGLGSGLGFSYRETADRPGRALTGRTPFLEWALLDRLGVGVAADEGGEWEHAWGWTADHLAAGRPVLLFADRGRLEYHPADVGVTPHPVLVVGHDEGTVHVSDADRPDVERVPVEMLEAATASPDLPGRHRRLAVTDPSPGVEPDAVAGEAIEATATFMLQPAVSPYDPGEGAHGLGGMQHLVATTAEWSSLPAPRATARAAAREIRGREGDGAAYRDLWRVFLASADHPYDAITEGMDDVVAAWQEVADALARAGEEGSDFGRHLDDAAAGLSDLADSEARLYTTAG